MVSAISNDQSELLKLLMSQNQSSKSTDKTNEASDASDTSFAGLLQSSESSEDSVLEKLTSLQKNVGMPAGMFIKDASSSTQSASSDASSSEGSSSSSGGTGGSGGSSSYDTRDTNFDGVVSLEEMNAALGIQSNSDSAGSKILKQLEQAYGISDSSSDTADSLLSLTI